MQSEYLDQYSVINASQDSFEEGGQMLAAAMGYSNTGIPTSSGFTQQDDDYYTSFYHQQLQQVIQQQYIAQENSLYPGENDKPFDEPLPEHHGQPIDEEAPTMYVTKRRKIDHNQEFASSILMVNQDKPI